MALTGLGDRVIDEVGARLSEGSAGLDPVTARAAVLDAVDATIFDLLELLQRGILPLRAVVEDESGNTHDLLDFCLEEASAEPSGLYWTWLERFSVHPRPTP